MLFIGIDLGTSSTKLLLSDEKGNILNTVSNDYPLMFPHPGWSEQDPELWWKACTDGIPELLEGFDASRAGSCLLLFFGFISPFVMMISLHTQILFS